MRVAPLKDLLELADAGVWGDEDPASGTSVLRSTNFRGDGRLDFDNLSFRRVEEPKRTQKLLREGDILLEKSGGGPKQPVGRVCLYRGHEKPHAFGNFLSRLRPRRDIVEPEWLFYRLWHFHNQGFTTSYQKQTSGIRNLETKRYLQLPIGVPTLSEQRRIVDLLSRAENIVRMRRETEAKAKGIVPALFLDMFGDPATNPRGWDTEPLGALGTLDRGRSRNRPRDAPHLYGGPYPFVQTGDIARSGGVISKFTQTYSEAGLEQSRLWPAGTLCITIAANIAESGVLGFDACFPDSVVGFLPRVGIQTDYVQQWLGFLKPTLAAQAPQAAQKNINLAILRSLKVTIPPASRQEHFSKLVTEIREIQKSQASANGIAIQAFRSLLGRVFRGEAGTMS